MTAGVTPYRRGWRASTWLDFDRLVRPALILAVVLSGLLLLHLTRGTSFWADDWAWIATRRGNTVDAFLAPYNGHLSLVPVAIYRVMFAVLGIGDFGRYRLLLVAVSSATGIVVFDYARHRVGEFCALLVAALLMFLGPGWNDLVQPFQIAWLIAVACGILAFSLLDRHRRAADVAACLLILASISSTSVGVALAVGIAVDIAIVRRRWGDVWILGVPLVLYAIWTLHYHPSVISLAAITSAPLALAETAAATVAGVIGLSGVTPLDPTALSISDDDVPLSAASTIPQPGGADGAPVVNAVLQGAVSHEGACERFVPTATLAAGSSSAVAVQPTPGRVSISAGDAPVATLVRRFAPVFSPLATVSPESSAVIVTAGDLEDRVWRLELQSTAPIRICALAPV